MNQNAERSHSQGIKPERLVYVDLGPANGGMMLNVSEDGFSFRAANPVRRTEKIHFAFEIGRTRLEGTGELEWTAEDGRVGGLQFTDVSDEFRAEVRRWLKQSQPSVDAGSEFLPAATAPADRLEEPRPDLEAELSKAQPVHPLAAKPEMKMEAPPAAPATAAAADKQPSREGVQTWKPETLWPPIEAPEPAKLLHPVAPTVETPQSQLQSPAVLNFGKPEIENKTALLAELPATDTPRVEAVVVPDQVETKAVRGRAVDSALPSLTEQREEPTAQWSAVERKRSKELAIAKEAQAGFSPPLSRVAAVGIVTVGVAVVLAATALSFRREVGQSLIRLGEMMVGETKPADPEPRPTPMIPPVAPAINPSPNLPSKLPAADTRTNPVPAETPPVQKPPSSPAAGPKPAAPAIPPQEPGRAEFAAAQRILASKYGSRDITGAMKLLWVAVQKGNSAAVLTLSDLYVHGEVAAKNCAQARVLLTTAVKKGNADAVARLGRLPQEGCP
jgi:hypothetical protein